MILLHNWKSSFLYLRRWGYCMPREVLSQFTSTSPLGRLFDIHIFILKICNCCHLELEMSPDVSCVQKWGPGEEVGYGSLRSTMNYQAEFTPGRVVRSLGLLRRAFPRSVIWKGTSPSRAPPFFAASWPFWCKQPFLQQALHCSFSGGAGMAELLKPE